MMAENNDLEPFEKEWLKEAATQVESLRKSRSGCPPLQLIRAARAQALPEELQSAVAAHIETCSSCRNLGADLGSVGTPPDLPLPDAEQILSRVRRDTRISAKSREAWLWSWRTALLAAGLALCGVLIVWQVRKAALPPVASVPAVDVPHSPPVSRPQSVLTLEKPEVKLTMAVLTWRGSNESREQFGKDIASALNLYRADNFAAAEPLLSSLSSKYPDSVEVLFYVGICRLFLAYEPGAVEALEKASRTKDDSFTADISWYLGLAYQRSGRIREARARFAALCEAKSIYTERACAAVKELDASVASR